MGAGEGGRRHPSIDTAEEKAALGKTVVDRGAGGGEESVRAEVREQGTEVETPPHVEEKPRAATTLPATKQHRPSHRTRRGWYSQFSVVAGWRSSSLVAEREREEAERELEDFMEEREEAIHILLRQRGAENADAVIEEVDLAKGTHQHLPAEWRPFQLAAFWRRRRAQAEQEVRVRRFPQGPGGVQRHDAA